MRTLAAVALVVCLLPGIVVGLSTGQVVAGPASSGPAPIGPAGSTDPSEAAPTVLDAESQGAIVEVYPNPVRENDMGEYVVVEYPEGAGWTLTDGETTVRLPGDAGRAVVTDAPEEVNATGRVVHAAGFALANGGETLRLRHGPSVVDAVTYETAPESEVLRPDDGGWRPRGATDFRPTATGPTTVEAFVLPDAPGVPVEALRSADRRILLAGYTLSSWRVARALAAAHERGATVAVLVEGGPVGGIARRQGRVLDWLVARGVAVQVLDGPRARYAYQHAKYAVVDDRALVLTENFVPAGTGGHSSRGWGVVVRDADAAAHLARVFEADAGWRDTVAWSEFRRGRRFETGGASNATYPGRFRPRRLPVEDVRVLAAPDNAEAEIVEVVRNADESVLVQQVSVGGRDQPFVRATVAAARDGARVRVLLSSAWYVREENRRTVARLNALAAREGLPLAARLAEPRSRYGKIHAKGAVVDGDTVVLGSVNWNNHSARENREVAVVLEGDAVGRYYARAVRADWRGGTRRLPVGVALTVVLAVGAAAASARALTFERQR